MKIKTKLYTKKQIQEAIAFWSKILENTSPLIDELVEDFGYDVVFGNKKIVPTMKMIDDIYDIINANLFKNKLVKCPIQHDIGKQCKIDNAAMLYYNTLYTDSIDNPTKYILLTQTGEDSQGNVFYPPRILVSDYILNHRISLIALVNIVAHEMIHQYIIEVSDGVEQQFKADYITHEKYDEHKGEFIYWMNHANSDYGLNVSENGSVMTYDDDSVKSLKKFANDDYTLHESKTSSDTMKVVHYDSGYVELRFL